MGRRFYESVLDPVTETISGVEHLQEDSDHGLPLSHKESHLTFVYFLEVESESSSTKTIT